MVQIQLTENVKEALEYHLVDQLRRKNHHGKGGHIKPVGFELFFDEVVGIVSSKGLVFSGTYKLNSRTTKPYDYKNRFAGFVLSYDLGSVIEVEILTEYVCAYDESTN